MNSIGLGNEFKIVDDDGVTRWALRFREDGDIDLVRFNSSGVEQETPLTIDWASGEFDFGENAEVNYRTVASDVVPTIVRGDSVIELLASASGAKVILTDTSGDGAVEVGQEVTFFLTARSGGSYTLALSTGTLTFDAALECAKVVRTSLGWNVVSLNGATIV